MALASSYPQGITWRVWEDHSRGPLTQVPEALNSRSFQNIFTHVTCSLPGQMSTVSSPSSPRSAPFSHHFLFFQQHHHSLRSWVGTSEAAMAPLPPLSPTFRLSGGSPITALRPLSKPSSSPALSHHPGPGPHRLTVRCPQQL